MMSEGRREVERKQEVENLFKFAQGQKYDVELFSKTIGNNKLFLNIYSLC